MLNWQFLLQKEGCLIWEAIDSPKLTIEAGIYRILGRGNCQEKEAEIHCNYQDFSPEKSPKCLSKKVRRINPVGLVMIIPFTYFNPGYWEFTCRSSTFEEILGDFWDESFQLQVLPAINPRKQPEKKFRNKLNLESEQKISSSSLLKLKPIETNFTPARIFGFPQEIPRKKTIAPSKTAEFFASRKVRSLLLYKETIPSLAGVALNAIENKYRQLLEVFIKVPLPPAISETILEKPAERNKTEIEDLSAKLNLPEINKMVRVTTKLRSSLGQILPPKISGASHRKKPHNYPELPKINSTPIPTINLNKATSFKIQRDKKKIFDRTWKNERDSIDSKFAALKSKERFWSQINSLIITPKSTLKVDRVASNK